MKTQFKLYFLLLFAAIFTISCSKSDEGVSTPDNSISMELASFSAESYPTEINKWIITDDATTTYDDFEGLRNALLDAIDDNREIELEFPNLDHLPESALYVGWPIYLTSVVSISAPNAISIGNSAFGHCTALTTISLPKATTIGNTVFWACNSLESISLPEVTSIDYSAFTACSSLKSISLPKMTTIGDGVFNTCTSLADIEVDGDYFVFENPILFNADKSEIICAMPSIGGEYTAPSSVTSVRSLSFAYCDDLESVSLPMTSSINDLIFVDCDNLQSVSMPEVTSIGNLAFYNCFSLESLEIATNSGVVLTSVGTNVFYDVPLSNVTLMLGSANSSMIDSLFFNAPNENGINAYGPFCEIVMVD